MTEVMKDGGFEFWRFHCDLRSPLGRGVVQDGTMDRPQSSSGQGKVSVEKGTS